jgi:hypothetical protein
VFRVLDIDDREIDVVVSIATDTGLGGWSARQMAVRQPR